MASKTTLIKPKKKTSPKQRRVIGMYVSGGGGKVGLTYAHAIYEVSYLEGNTVVVKHERGRNLRVLPGFQDFNGTKKQKERYAVELRPQYESMIRAAATLMHDIEQACVDIDDKLREDE